MVNLSTEQLNIRLEESTISLKSYKKSLCNRNIICVTIIIFQLSVCHNRYRNNYGSTSHTDLNVYNDTIHDLKSLERNKSNLCQ